MNSQKDIIAQLSGLARRVFSRGEGEVYLYGSRAKGNAREDSDYDLLVVTDDAVVSEDRYVDFAFPFAEVGWRLGVQITPIHYTRSEWISENNTAFYRNVISTAIRL